MANSFLPYEYFSGANVLVSIEDFPVVQAAGMSMNIQESKVPIYGYSSRHFDAVARGRVLVSGSLVVNYVHQDYLFRLIEMALRTPDPNLGAQYDDLTLELRDTLGDPTQAVEASELLYTNYTDFGGFSQYFKSKYWDNPSANIAQPLTEVLSPNPHDSFGGLTIDVTFGERSERTGYNGTTGFRIHDVYFLSRGTSVQIDETTIVEEYSWFGRNVTNIPPRGTTQSVNPSNPGTDPAVAVQ